MTNIKPVDSRTFTECMEQLQQGYVLSVAATAGCTVEIFRHDNNGYDVQFTSQRGPDLEEVSLYAQLKNTTTKVPDPSKPFFSYQFKKRQHFDQLTKARSTIKSVLIVMVSEPEQAAWTSGDHESLSVRRCCYWTNIEGQQSPAKTPTVQIPTEQIFSAEALSLLMKRVEEGRSL